MAKYYYRRHPLSFYKSYSQKEYSEVLKTIRKEDKELFEIIEKLENGEKFYRYRIVTFSYWDKKRIHRGDSMLPSQCKFEIGHNRIPLLICEDRVKWPSNHDPVFQLYDNIEQCYDEFMDHVLLVKKELEKRIEIETERKLSDFDDYINLAKSRVSKYQ